MQSRVLLRNPPPHVTLQSPQSVQNRQEPSTGIVQCMYQVMCVSYNHLTINAWNIDPILRWTYAGMLYITMPLYRFYFRAWQYFLLKFADSWLSKYESFCKYIWLEHQWPCGSLSPMDKHMSSTTRVLTFPQYSIAYLIQCTYTCALFNGPKHNTNKT